MAPKLYSKAIFGRIPVLETLVIVSQKYSCAHVEFFVKKQFLAGQFLRCDDKLSKTYF